MNIAELYASIPVERHSKIVVSGDRLFFDREKFVIAADGTPKLACSPRGLKEDLV